MEEEFYIPEQDITFSMKMVRFYFQRMSWIAPNYSAKLFWKLFTQPRKRPLNLHHQNFLQKAQSKNYTSEQFKAPYTVHRFGCGSKKVLICHGWEGRTVDFKNIIAGLIQVKELEIISIDFPGHGTSPQNEAHLPIFVDVISHFIQTEPDVSVFLGHSLGAASLAVAVGEMGTDIRDKKMILMGLHPEPSQFFFQYKKITRINEKVFKKCVNLAEQKVSRTLLDLDCHHYVEVYNQNKMLFVHDTEDKIIHLRRVVDFAQKLENAKVYHSKGGGHFKHFKNQDVLEVIIKYVNED